MEKLPGSCRAGMRSRVARRIYRVAFVLDAGILSISLPYINTNAP